MSGGPVRLLVCAACIPKVSRKDGAEFAGDVYRCPGAPFRVLRKFEGTFASVTSFGKYGGDLCVTVLTGPLQHVKHANVQCSREKKDAGLARAPSPMPLFSADNLFYTARTRLGARGV